MKFSKGGMGKRMLYKSEKWIWNVYSKEKRFWEDGGSKLIRVRHKAQAERGEKWNKIPHSIDQGWGKAKWSKTEGEYSMGFKVQTNSKQISVLLEKYSNNHDILPN